MKKIYFLVPISYDIPTILKDTNQMSPERLCLFFDSVAYMLEHMTNAIIHNTKQELIHSILQDMEYNLKKEKEYTEQLKIKIQEEKEQCNNIMIQYKKTCEEEYEKELEIYKQCTQNEIELLKNKIDEITTTYQLELKTKNNEQHYLQELYTLHLKDKDNTLNSIQLRIDEMMSIFQTISSSTTSKGKFGENCVNHIIQQFFPHAEIQDVSKIPHSGDTVIKINDYVLMVEIKTKKHVTKDDIVKFEKDILLHSNEYNGALFVTTSTGIPVKGEYCFELLENNIPVLYITKCIDNPELLNIGIHILIHLIPIFKKMTSSSINNIDEEYKYALNTITLLLKKIQCTCDIIKQNQKTYIILEKQIQLQKKNNEDLLNNCKKEITVFLDKYNCI